MRVLLVEDDQSLAQGIRSALRDEGYTLDWLADGLSAADRSEVVLLDLGLPRCDGLSLLRDLRAQPDGDVPVLILTARDATRDRILGLDAGADDYLVTSPSTWTSSRRASAPCCAAARVVRSH